MKTGIIETNGLEVEYEWWRAYKGQRENGIPIEPDEPAGFEIIKITDLDTGKEIEYSSQIYDWVAEALEEEQMDRAAQKADWEYEQYKDEKINWGGWQDGKL